MRAIHQTTANLIVNAICFCAASLIVLSSCTRVVADKETPGQVSGEDIIICNVAEVSDTSKTTIASGFIQKWVSNDQIAVLGIDGAPNKFTLFEGEGTSRGSFMGALPASDVYVAYYPYSSDVVWEAGELKFSIEQDRLATSGDLAAGACPMVGTFYADNPEPVFKNVFGIIEFKLSGTAKVGKLKLTDNDSNAMLWGDFSLDIDGDHGTDRQVMSVSGGSNIVYLSFGSPIQLSEGTTTTFYFALPANTLSHGFCLEVYDESLNLVYYKETSRTQTIYRSSRRTLPALSGVDKRSDAPLDPEPFTWSAYNNLARTGTEFETVIDPQSNRYPSSSLRPNRYVGMFYFIWHNQNSGGPYDNQKALGAGNYEYNPSANYTTAAGSGIPHHWGEPYLGYYKGDDAWVFRKQAQMLVDAGVDFIAFDVSNNQLYEAQVTKLLDVYLEMREEGNRTPQVTFLIWHSNGNAPGGAFNKDQALNHTTFVKYLYDHLYNQSKYADLWFYWDGKPLMLALKNTITNNTIKNYFTYRASWYIWNQQWQTPQDANDPWWNGSSEDKWPWAECYIDDTNNTMHAGTHNGVNEMCPVSPATHPVSNIGRSYPINSGVTYKSGSYTKEPAKGTYFKAQFTAAKNLLDAAANATPQVLFFTGWNEYLVGDFTSGGGWLNFYYCCGYQLTDGDGKHLFIDQYNNEFSRDLEPIKGDFGDSYYYYMSDFIREYKGVDQIPVYSRQYAISIDGRVLDWDKVNSCYADDKGDVKARGYYDNSNGWPGYANYATLVNNTGRNDLNKSKIATDGTNLFFYVDAVANLTGYDQGANGLNLLIKSQGGTNWEGFNYIVRPTGANSAKIYSCSGTGSLAVQEIGNVSFAAAGNALELSIPLSTIGIDTPSSFTVDFKWVDNVDLSAEDGIQQCMRDGDSAPNGRFCYRYVYRR